MASFRAGEEWACGIPIALVLAATLSAVVATGVPAYAAPVRTFESEQPGDAGRSSAEIAPGRHLALAFNVATRQLIARYSTDATY
jgi:hypothetical protein